MNKNIPNPIIKIGHSTKKNGEMSFDVDGNKIKKMGSGQFLDLLAQIDRVKRKAMSMRSGKDFTNGILNERQFDEIEKFIKEGSLLGAVKAYKEFTGVGLKEAKEAVEDLRDKMKLAKLI